MALAVLPALFTCLCYIPTGILSAYDGSPRHPHCPHVSRRSAGSFGNNGHPRGRSAIGHAAALRHAYRGFTWPRPFGRPGPFIPVVVLSVVPYTNFRDDRFRKGIQPSIVQPVRPFGPGTAPASPRRFRRGLRGWCPVPVPVSVPPSPARLAAWPLGAWPASRVPSPGVPGWWRGPWALGASRRASVVRPGPCGLGASRGVRGRGVPWRPSRRVSRRLAAWRPAHHHPRRGGYWCARPGPVASAVARGAPVGALWAVRPAPVGAWWWRGVRGLSPVARGRPRGGVPWPWGVGPCARCPRPSRRGVVPVSRRPASPVGAWRGVRCQ